jgi:hypothetical protein
VNVINRYHSGSISNGVAKGKALTLIFKGSDVDSPNIFHLIPKGTIGKMYRISLGHADSP